MALSCQTSCTRRAAQPILSRLWNALNLHDELIEIFPEQAPYAVSLAYRVRFLMHLNAREAMHMLELRTTPQGHLHTGRFVRRCTHLLPKKLGISQLRK